MANAFYYIVSLSEQAFFSIVTSALEAYSILHGKSKGGAHIPEETYGNLWGHEATTKRKEKVFHIALADVDTSAERSPGQVVPKEESFALKEAFIDRFHPELEYLGDFHSHPYDRKHDSVTSTLDVERKELYGFSDADFASFRHLRKARNYRVGLVATIYKSDKAVARVNKHVGDEDYSCIRFSYDDLTIWLKCCVFGEKRRISDRKVALVCSSLGFHVGAIEQN